MRYNGNINVWLIIYFKDKCITKKVALLCLPYVLLMHISGIKNAKLKQEIKKVMNNLRILFILDSPVTWCII